MAENFLDSFEGQGFENVSQGDVITPLLLVAQKMSKIVDGGAVQPGHFYNSVTSEDYGEELRIVICHYQKMWYAWKPNQGGLAGIYQPGTLNVTGDVYTGMTDEAGNKVEEKMVFLVALPDHVDAGLLLFGSTPGTIKFTKSWLTQAQNLRLPSGKIAPLFGAVWNVKLGKITSKDGNVYYGPAVDGKSSFRFESWIPEELYTHTIAPGRQKATLAIEQQDYKSQQSIESDSESEPQF